MSTLIQDIKINSVKEAEEILKAAGTENLFEKAHFDGEIHRNGKWVWRSSVNNGKGDWRMMKKNDSGNTKEPVESKQKNEEKESSEVEIKGEHWKFNEDAMSNLSTKERKNIVDIMNENNFISTRRLIEDNDKVKFSSGGTYSMTQFSNSLNKVSGNAAKNKFLKENEKGYYDYLKNEKVENEDIQNLILSIGNNYNVYNYFNKYLKPSNIQIKDIGSIKEEIQSNNIYSLMSAKRYKVKEISFDLGFTEKRGVIHIKTRMLINGTLNIKDITNFM